MKKVLILLAFAFPIVFWNSCKHDPILPETQVSFANDIVPIINTSCMHSGCHNDTLNPEAHLMNTYDDVVAHEYVVPGKPHDSRMYNSVIGAGEEFMPKQDNNNYPPLNDRQVRLLFIWIAQGAKNN